MCWQEGGWQNTWKSLLYCPLASSEWRQKSLVAVMLSDVIFPVGWDYWPENGKSEAPEDIPILAASLCQTSFSSGCTRDGGWLGPRWLWRAQH